MALIDPKQYQNFSVGSAAPESIEMTPIEKQIRKFETGATRDVDANKYDYEGFLSPAVLERFGAYMHKHRIQADGNLRDSGNWQKGIPRDAYMKSLLRHVFALWRTHRRVPEVESIEDSLCAIMFNTMGYLFEEIKNRTASGDTKCSG